MDRTYKDRADYRRNRSPSVGEKAKRTVEDAAGKVGETVNKAGRKLEDAAGAAGEKIERTASNVSNAVRNHVPAPAQAVFGAAVGGLAGVMDANYVEPFGTVFGSALLAIQLLEHEGVVSLPWNNAVQPSSHEAHHPISRAQTAGFLPALQAIGRETIDFVGNNVYIAAGFAGGYFLAKNVLASEPALE